MSRRRSYRERQGCTEVPLPEAEISVPLSDLDSLRPRVEVTRLDQSASASRQMVAEMMILAGTWGLLQPAVPNLSWREKMALDLWLHPPLSLRLR